MITLAIDTATDRCSVAASDGTRIEARHVDGARRHGGAIIALIDAVIAPFGGIDGVGVIVTADGPGSFTGLRVAATVAKALLWRRTTTWRTAPSLLVQAFALAGPHMKTVLAVSNALRGEVFAGCWTVTDRIVPVGAAPRAMRVADLGAFGRVDAVSALVPPALAEEIATATGVTPVVGAAALPDARHLLTLAGLDGGTHPILDPVHWEPDYGRPAAAQDVWEQRHGRRLPDPAHRAG